MSWTVKTDSFMYDVTTTPTQVEQSGWSLFHGRNLCKTTGLAIPTLQDLGLIGSAVGREDEASTRLI